MLVISEFRFEISSITFPKILNFDLANCADSLPEEEPVVCIDRDIIVFASSGKSTIGYTLSVVEMVFVEVE